MGEDDDGEETSDDGTDDDDETLEEDRTRHISNPKATSATRALVRVMVIRITRAIECHHSKTRASRTPQFTHSKESRRKSANLIQTHETL